MNYELALKLKEAGFPQNTKGGRVIYFVAGKSSDGAVVEPTLEELIEECGDEFESIKKMSVVLGGWYAYKISESEDSLAINLFIYGSTPSEAVANLWLALNKK